MRRRFIRRGGPKRKYAWGGARIGGTVLMNDGDVGAFWVRAPSGSFDTTYDPPLVVEPDVTLIRTRCLYAFSNNNQGSQLNQAHTFACGIIAWDGLTDNPVDVGLLPHPAIDLSLDWVWRNTIPSPTDNIAVGGNGPSALDAYESKAQRKLSNGTGLLFVYGYTGFNDVPESLVTVLAADIRYLVKLP